MNIQKQLDDFLQNNGPYSLGVEIYNAIGTDNYLKTFLFARAQNAYSFERLKSELRKIHTELRAIEAPVLSTKPKAELPPKEKPQGLSVDDFFNLPQELQRRRLEIGQLYSEIVAWRKQVHAQLGQPYQGTITLQECFDIMFQLDSRGRPVPFNITWLTWDEKRQTGGQVKKLDCFLKNGNRTGSKFKPVTAAVSDRRDPRHDIHGTINLQIKNTFEIRKAHTWLIFSLNGYKVILGTNG